MRMHGIACAAVVGALFVHSGPAFAHEGAASKEDPVVARVNGEEIHHSEVVRLRARARRMRMGQSAEQIDALVLDRLIDNILAAQAARNAKLEEDPAVREELKRARVSVLARAYWRHALKQRSKDEDLKKAYEKFVKTFKGQEEIKARHILVKTEDEAKAVIAALEKGADFAELAKTKSTGSTAKRGGDLGYFARSRMVKAFSDAAFALKPGEITKTPVKTKFGWHVIKMEDKRTSQPPSFERKRKDLAAKRSSSDFSAIRSELRKGAKIERFDVTGQASDGAPTKKK